VLVLDGRIIGSRPQPARPAWQRDSPRRDELPVTDMDIQEVPIDDVIRQIFVR